MSKAEEIDQIRLDNIRIIHSIQSKSYDQRRMKTNIEAWCRELGAEVISRDGNLYVTKGKAKTYPCVVAHMDTVHDMIPNRYFKVYYDDTQDALWAKNTKTGAQTGVGGDDNVGIFLALEALSDFDNIKLAFFRDEEVGCVGSRKAHMPFFKDVAFVLQGDRRGIGDFVNMIGSNKLYDKAFSDAIEPILKDHSRKEVRGGMTDVNALVIGGIEVCVANASCGYYEPHSSWEYVTVAEAFSTSDMFSSIIRKLYKDGERWLCDRTPVSFNHNRSANVVSTYKKGAVYNQKTRKWVTPKKKPVPNTMEVDYNWVYDDARKGFVKQYMFLSNIPLSAIKISVKQRNQLENRILQDPETSKKAKAKLEKTRRDRTFSWNHWKTSTYESKVEFSCQNYAQMQKETNKDIAAKKLKGKIKNNKFNSLDFPELSNDVCETCYQTMTFDESVYKNWCHSCHKYEEIYY